MERKYKTQASVFLAAFLFLSIFASSAHAELIAAPIDSLQDSGMYIAYLVLDSFGACNVDPDGKLYDSDEISSTNVADRCKGYGLRGGNFIFYIILPLILAYLILYAIMEKTNIFEKKTSRNISIALALLMIPLGIYRIVFITLMSILAGGTVTLLYVFLFVLMLGWGYKNMWKKGRIDITETGIHLQESKHAAEHVKNANNSIKELNGKLVALAHKQGELAHQKAMINANNSRRPGESDDAYISRLGKIKSDMDEEKKSIDEQIKDIKSAMKHLIALKEGNLDDQRDV